MLFSCCINMSISNIKSEFITTEICRVCLEVDTTFFNVYTTEFVSSKTIAALIMECAPVQITQGDGLSDLICDDCFERLQIAFQFRVLCVQSDNELRSKLVKQEKCLSIEEVLFDNSVNFNFMKKHNVSNNQDILKSNETDRLRWQNINDLKKKSSSSNVHKKITATINNDKDHQYNDHFVDDVEMSLSEDSDSKNRAEKNMESKKKPEFICDICKKVFRHLKIMEFHKKRHDKRTGKKDSSLTCDKCGKVLYNHGGLLAHIRTVHSKERPFECKICNKRFKDKQTLGKHNFTHNSELSFLCEQCGMAFRYLSNLYKHHHTHSDVRKYLCNVCGKSFKTEEVRKLHKVIHTGEKPFECVHCNKRFNFKRNLREHQLVHTKERPFKCNICNEVFRSRTKLMMHRKGHLI